jgi:hypothetical protein
MNDLGARLRELPASDLGGRWPEVAARLARRQRREYLQRKAGFVAALASLTLLAVLFGARILDRPYPGQKPLVGATRPATPAPEHSRLAGLRARSFALEGLLADLPERPALARAGTALPVDELEAHVQWLDHRLSQVATDPMIARPAEASAERLWRERNEALDALLVLRYAEFQALSL